MGAVKVMAVASKTVKAPAPKPRLLQPSLKVGAVNDPAEREAESMASRVVASSAPAELAVADPAPTGSNIRRATDDQPNLDTLTPPSIPGPQAEVTVADKEDVATTDLKSEDTSELDSGEPADTSGQPIAEDTPPIPEAPLPIMEMRRTETDTVVGRSGGAAPRDVANLVAAPGPGRPLPRAVRQRIEPHFGTSFENVRIHDSPSDRRAAVRIGARAFTHKNRIWLGEGESETNTRLMAHELTHVVQQTKGSDTLPLAREPAVIRRGYFANKAESLARHIPGYTLMTVLVGRKLVSGKKVAMTAENLLAGFLGLIPGGTLIFDRLKEAKVIQEGFDFVKGKLTELNLTWDRIKGDLSDALDTIRPWKAIKNVKRMFVNLVRDIVRFVKALAVKLLEFIVRGALKLAGSYGEQVWAVIQKAGNVIKMILEDPLGFAKNLVKAVVGGFRQFAKNIFSHLKKGLLGWLFGALTSAGIKIPAKLDFKGLISLVLQIIGVTYENFRKRLVKKLGPKGEKMVSMMEKSVEVVKILLKEGFAGIWQKLVGMIENFKTTLIGGMSTMILKSLVEAGIGWLAALSNPVGAILKIVLAIYNMVKTFIERFQQIKDVAESIFSSVGAIARGQTEKAANFIEQTIGRTVPLVISFVAALVPISGITTKVKGVINSLQGSVFKAMDKMIGFVMKKAKKLFSKLIAKVNGKRKYPSANFKIGEKQHRIFAQQAKGGKLTIMMASGNPELIDAKEAGQKAQLAIIEKAQGATVEKAKKIGKTIQYETVEADDETTAKAKKVKTNSTKENQLEKIKRLQAELDASALELQTAAIDIDKCPDISSQSPKLLFRAAEPRKVAIEGQQDTHKSLMDRSKKEFNVHIPNEVSSFYEMDHTIEKRFPKAILENLPLLNKDTAIDKRAAMETRTAEDRADRSAAYNAAMAKRKAAGEKKLGAEAGKKTTVKDEEAKPLGKIGTGAFAKIPETAPMFPAVAMYRHNHIAKKGDQDPIAIIGAAKKDDAPHDVVKKAIAAQLDSEAAAMNQAMADDKNANPQLVNNVKTGIEMAKAATADIFGLGDIGAKPVTAADYDKDPKNDTATTLTFKGGSSGPNFESLEGVGGPYSKLKSKGGKHLERDHIIDKSLPLAAKAAPLLNGSEKSDLEAQVKAQLQGPKRRNMTKTRKARQTMILSADLFDADSNMKTFTAGNGYAIPIYTPLANRVTSATRIDAPKDKVAANTGKADIAALVAYVIDGTGDAVTDTQRAKQAKLKPYFDIKTLEHALAVGNEYNAETVKTGAAQIEKDAAVAATNSMKTIQNNVAGSIQKTRGHTTNLFA